jgi:hypothetical protein
MPLRGACCVPGSFDVKAAQMRRSLCSLVFMSAAAAGAANEPAPVVQHSLAKTGYEIAAEHCGAQAKRSQQRAKNPFDETVIDQRETIQCKGLVLVVYHAAIYKPPHPILESLTLRGTHIKLPKPISPGSTRDEVLAYAGQPMQTNPTSLIYLLTDEGPDQHTATFEFANGKLSSITWWWSSQ